MDDIFLMFLGFDFTSLPIYGKCLIFSAIYSTYILLGCHLRSPLPVTNVTVKCAPHTHRSHLFDVALYQRPKSCGCPWCQSRRRENEVEDNRKRDKSLNMLPPTHPTSQHSMSPPTITPNSPSVQSQTCFHSNEPAQQCH